MQKTTDQKGTRNQQGFIVNEAAVKKHAAEIRKEDAKATKNFAKSENKEVPLNLRPKEIQETQGVVMDVLDKQDPTKAVKGY